MFDEGALSLGEGARALVVAPPAGFDPGPLMGADLSVSVDDFAANSAIQARGISAEAACEHFDIALFFLGRHSALNQACIADTLSRLRPGGTLLVEGPKANGADSMARTLRKLLPVEGVLSKAHGKVIWLQRPEALPAELSTWARAADLAENKDGFWAAPGMFSHDAVDPGTAFLAEHLPADAKGRAADLGAGWGALSARLLAACPGLLSLDLIEASAAALEAAKRNISDPRARFHWQDATHLPAGLDGYDWIFSNPPFHTTRKAEPELGIAFIQAAAAALSPKGRFVMVANRHLPYENALTSQFTTWEEIATSPAYKILEARIPKRRKG